MSSSAERRMIFLSKMRDQYGCLLRQLVVRNEVEMVAEKRRENSRLMRQDQSPYYVDA